MVDPAVLLIIQPDVAYRFAIWHLDELLPSKLPAVVSQEELPTVAFRDMHRPVHQPGIILPADMLSVRPDLAEAVV